VWSDDQHGARMMRGRRLLPLATINGFSGIIPS
jgi:hypothetical protein